MLLSMKWLNDYVDVQDIPIKEFCDKMTMAGSKVEGYRFECEEIENVVVGKIISIKKHPDADKLLVCEVDVAAEKLLQVVTAAKNIFEGALVPVALHKSKIAGGVVIKKGKLRGVVSEGMFCSIAELNVTLSDFPDAVEDGILIIKDNCEIGQDIKKALGLDDTIVDFEITPNRPDCLSVIGLAREVSAVFDRPFKNLNNKKLENKKAKEEILKVNVEDENLCKRYIAIVAKNVKIEPSPRWMRERLKSSGVRPINNIVDITNYVMLEYGQPIHAFDYDKILSNHIVVRKAKNNECIDLLDGSRKNLDDDMLLITNGKIPLALAGVMGGKSSGISEQTNKVVFEVANFDKDSVRKTSNKLAIRTESSMRFEKGIDCEILPNVVNRILELIDILKAGNVDVEIIDVNNVNSNCKNNKLYLDLDFINNLLGLDLSLEEVKNILLKLFIKVKNNEVEIPSWREDITCLADIAEEVARIYGYSKIPAVPSKCVANPVAVRNEWQKFNNSVMDFMVSQGYYEIKTFSFISPKSYNKINLKDDNKKRESVTIINPLGEDTSVMRTTAIPSMLESISKNYSNRNLDCRFFEVMKEYIPSKDGKLPIEKDKVIIGLCGKKYNFYNIKGVVEDLFSILNLKECDFIAQSKEETFHPGRCANIFINEDNIGVIGQIHPKVADNYQVMDNVFIADLDLKLMFNNKVYNKFYKQVNKFPSVMRDLALVCDKELPVAAIEKLIKELTGNTLECISLNDVYMGEQIGKDKKSVCYSLKFRSLVKTLTDDDIDIIINKVLEMLKQINVFIR